MNRPMPILTPKPKMEFPSSEQWMNRAAPARRDTPVARMLDQVQDNQRALFAAPEAGFHMPDVNRSLARRFHRELGITFRQFSTLVRLESAEFLLRHTRANPSEVARMVGYASYASFRTHFKIKNLVSPKAYRAKKSGSASPVDGVTAA